ncbi:MFS transporter [Nonomuraea longicatena]|uniref:MFS transporter n=1 Tax=Nonomuraea longicatena TaxID=83682 RepID=A0ABN1QS15_9ACTN
MTTVRIRLTRDLPTWLIYLQLGTFATYLYTLSAALPLLREEQGVSDSVVALHGTAMAAGTLLAGPLLPWLARRYSGRAVVWIGLAGVNAGLLPVFLTSWLPATLLGYATASLFGSVALYAMMAALHRHHGPAGPAAISEANAVAVLFGMGGSYLLSVVGQSAFGWRAAMLSTPILTVVLALTLGRVHMGGRKRHPATGPATSPATGPVAGPPPGWRFHVACWAFFCVGALEFCYNLWAARLFADNTGMGAAAAATGLTAFTAGVAVGRFAGAPLALRLSTTTLLVGALGVTGVGWLVFWQSGEPLLAYTGLVISGIGVSLHFPLGLAGVMAIDPVRAPSVAPVYGGLAMGAGPFALGALSDGLGTRTAFLLVPVLIALAVGGFLAARPARSPNPAPAG